MKEHVRDLTAGIVLLAFSVIYFALTQNIRAFVGDGATPITARTMPRIWAVIAILCSGSLVIRSLWRIKREKEMPAESSPDEKMTVGLWLRHNYAVAGTFVILALYAAALKSVGYVVGTFFYLMIQIPLLTQKERLRERKYWLFTLILAAVFILVTDYMFVKWFSVRLPKGLIGF